MNLFIKMADGFTACIKADAWSIEDIHVVAWIGDVQVALIDKANIEVMYLTEEKKHETYR